MRKFHGPSQLQAYRAQLASNNFLDLAELSQQLASLASASTPLTVKLPATTRGLAEAVLGGYHMAFRLTKEPPISLNAFYRVTLAQFELQAIRSQLRDHNISLRQYHYEEFFAKYASFEQIVAAHPATLKLVVAVIEQYGTVSVGGKTYSPFIVDSNVDWSVEVRARRRGHRATGASTSALPHRVLEDGGERILEVRKGMGPDPYTVTFRNLENVVRVMSDENSVLEGRKWFVENNPLPGARYDDRYVLQNPDEIWPPNYTDASLSHEFQLLEAWISRLSGKFSYLTGRLSYSGKGSEAMSVGTLTDSHIATTLPQHVTISESETNYALDIISDQSMLLGTLSRWREYPDYSRLPDNVTTVDPRLYEINSQSGAVRKIVADWHALTAAVLARPV